MAEAWDAIASGYAQRAASFTGTFAPELLAAARVDAGAAGGSGAALLDVAAGSGAVALAAAALPGVSQVLACDISPAMLDELQALAASLPPDAARIETTPCDCTALPMADSSFDAAVSNFGVIFAPDVAAGLAEMARVTRPGGRLAFTTWGRTPAFSAIEDTWRSLLPATAPAAAAQADPVAAVSRIRQQLADVGGLDEISVEAVEHELVVDSPETYWERMLVSSPSRQVNMAAKLSSEEFARLRAATIEGLRERFPTEGQPVRLPAEAYVAAATKRATEGAL
jgi:ubiquinone/menaquinone biosynthesis C-methylase UbiE